MNAEALDEEILWQEVISGHLKWAAELEERLSVKIEVVLNGYGHIFDHGKIFGEHSDVCTAKAEMIEHERNVEQLYYSLTLLQHDPIRRGASYHDQPEQGVHQGKWDEWKFISDEQDRRRSVSLERPGCDIAAHVHARALHPTWR